MRQLDKGPRSKKAAKCRKREGIQQDRQADSRTGGREVSSRISIGLRKVNDWTSWRSRPPSETKEETSKAQSSVVHPDRLAPYQGTARDEKP
jgi:5-methylcytosine-specific restriction endonuclease McrA